MTIEKKTKDEAEDPIEGQAADTGTPGTDQSAGQEEVSLDDLEDPAKLEELNRKLRAARKADEPREGADGAGTTDTAGEQPPPPAEDRVLRTVKFYGQERPVKESEADRLLQLGLQLERIYPQVDPLYRAARSAPEVAQLFVQAAGDPALKARIIAAARGEQPAAAAPAPAGIDVSKVDLAKLRERNPRFKEYTDEELRDALTLQAEVLTATGIGAAPAPSAEPEPDHRAALGRQILDGARAMLGPKAYAENARFASEILREIRVQEGDAAADEFIAALNDPTRVNEDGEPAIAVFIREVDGFRRQMIAQAGNAAGAPLPAPPAPPARSGAPAPVNKPLPKPSARIAAGGGGGGDNRVFGKSDAYAFSNEEFERESERLIAGAR